MAKYKKKGKSKYRQTKEKQQNKFPIISLTKLAKNFNVPWMGDDLQVLKCINNDDDGKNKDNCIYDGGKDKYNDDKYDDDDDKHDDKSNKHDDKNNENDDKNNKYNKTNCNDEGSQYCVNFETYKWYKNLSFQKLCENFVQDTKELIVSDNRGLMKFVGAITDIKMEDMEEYDMFFPPLEYSEWKREKQLAWQSKKLIECNAISHKQDLLKHYKSYKDLSTLNFNIMSDVALYCLFFRNNSSSFITINPHRYQKKKQMKLYDELKQNDAKLVKRYVGRENKRIARTEHKKTRKDVESGYPIHIFERYEPIVDFKEKKSGTYIFPLITRIRDLKNFHLEFIIQQGTDFNIKKLEDMNQENLLSTDQNNHPFGRLYSREVNTNTSSIHGIVRKNQLTVTLIRYITMFSKERKLHNNSWNNMIACLLRVLCNFVVYPRHDIPHQLTNDYAEVYGSQKDGNTSKRKNASRGKNNKQCETQYVEDNFEDLLVEDVKNWKARDTKDIFDDVCKKLELEKVIMKKVMTVPCTLKSGKIINIPFYLVVNVWAQNRYDNKLSVRIFTANMASITSNFTEHPFQFLRANGWAWNMESISIGPLPNNLLTQKFIEYILLTDAAMLEAMGNTRSATYWRALLIFNLYISKLDDPYW